MEVLTKNREWRLTFLGFLFEILMTAAFLLNTQGLIAIKSYVRVSAEFTGDLQVELTHMRWKIPECLEFFLTFNRPVRILLVALPVALLWLLLLKALLKWDGLRGIGWLVLSEVASVGLTEALANKLVRNLARCAAFEDAVKSGTYTVSQSITRYEKVTAVLVCITIGFLLLEFLTTWVSVRWELRLTEIVLPVALICYMGVLLQLLGSGKKAAVAHFAYLLLGMAACLFFSAIGTLRLSRKMCCAACYAMILLALVGCVLGHISPANGSAAWVRLFGMSAQPGELFKIFVIIFYSNSFINLKSDKKVNTLFYITCFVLCAALLIVNDTGNMAILLILVIIVAINDDWWVGTCLTLSGLIGLPTVMRFTDAYGSIKSLPLSSALARISGRFSSALTVVERQDVNQETFRMTILSFLKGGLLGTGPSESRSCFYSTYAASSDYAFPTNAAVFGVAGVLAVVLPLLVLVHNSNIDYRFCRRTENYLAGKLSTSVLVIQAVVHIGSSLNLFPFIGTNFPFLSSGGSSMVCSWVLVGIILSARLGDAQSRIVYDITAQFTHSRLWCRFEAAVKYVFALKEVVK